MLQKIKEPVCVVSIAGPCRDGKSYILAEVFGQKEVFPVGHLVDPETTGIWIWIIPQKFQDSNGRPFRVVLLDSEGTNAVTAEGQSDNQIFTLTVLLSSILIYNSKGVPKRNDLNDLDFIVKLSQRIRIRSNGTHDDQELFRKTFPFFVWLLRDVSLQLPSECRDFNHYFSLRVFKDSKTSGNKDQQRVAKSILRFFSGFEAIALPTPTSDEDIMQEISQNRDKLNHKFLDGVERFQKFLKSKLAPKRSINKGEHVTGEALGALVELYTDAINDPNAIPNVETAWVTYVRKKCSEAKKVALETYDEAMTKLMSSRLPCESEDVQKNHETSQSQAMDSFDTETAELISTIIGRELNHLTKSFEEKLSFWNGKNDLETQKKCEDLLKKLKKEHLDPVLQRVGGSNSSKVTYGEIIEGWSRIKKEFNSKAVGAKNARADVFFKFNQYIQEEVMKYEDIIKKMTDYDDKLSKEKIANAYAEKEKKRLEENLAKLEKKQEAWQRKMEMIKKRQQDEINLIKEQAKVDREALVQQMQIMKEADMEAQARLEKELENVSAKEIQATKALEDTKELFEKAKIDAMTGREAADAIFKGMMEESGKAQNRLLEQLHAMTLRDDETNKRVQDLMRLLEEDRKDAADMRKVIESLRGELADIKKPGFFKRIWRYLF